jgi:CheY-like chemotaxis protein
MRRKTAKQIDPHTAALRRYARALSSEGGATVERVLQNLRPRDYRDLAPRDVRTRLFRDFHDAFDLEAPLEHDARSDQHGLMLRHTQGFSIQEVARILRRDVLELQPRLERAYAALHGQDGMDVLLIEGDPVLAQGMTEIIESLGHRVLGVARDQEEALSTADAIRLDAVVADIGDDGSDMARDRRHIDRLLGKSGTPIVLVAPDADAIADASGGQPAYLVSTPFQVSELKVMLSQALYRDV